MTSEKRILECAHPRPEAAPLQAAELYTTYSRLTRFLVTELERLVPGRVTIFDEHRLVVRCYIDCCDGQCVF